MRVSHLESEVHDSEGEVIIIVCLVLGKQTICKTQTLSLNATALVNLAHAGVRLQYS